MSLQLGIDGEGVGHTGAITSLSFHPGGRLIATASADGTVRVWDVDQEKSILKISVQSRVAEDPFRADHAIRSLSFSPDGKRLIIPSDDGLLRIMTMKVHEAIKFAGIPARIEFLLHRTISAHVAAFKCRYVGSSRIMTWSSFDRSVKLWEEDRDKPVYSLQETLAYPPTRKAPLSGDGTSVDLSTSSQGGRFAALKDGSFCARLRSRGR
jgi:WD40 repeat protein